MNSRPHDHLQGRTPHDHAIDEILDGDLSPERSHQLLRSLRHDARACEALARTRIGIERLREPVDAPDLTGDILARVHARRRFIPGRARRAVTAGRVAIAAGVVGAVALASFTQRHAPQLRSDDQPTPVSRIVQVTEQSTPAPAQINDAVASLGASIAAPARRLSLQPAYRPEQQLHFDVSLDRSAPTTTRFEWSDRQAIVVGAPVTFEQPVADSTLISRFGSLLVILREPTPPIDDQAAEHE